MKCSKGSSKYRKNNIQLRITKKLLITLTKEQREAGPHLKYSSFLPLTMDPSPALDFPRLHDLSFYCHFTSILLSQTLRFNILSQRWGLPCGLTSADPLCEQWLISQMYGCIFSQAGDPE